MKQLTQQHLQLTHCWVRLTHWMQLLGTTYPLDATNPILGATYPLDATNPMLGTTNPLDATNPILGATYPLMHNFRPCLKCACPITISIVIHTFLFLALGKLDVLDYLINELGVDPVARDKSGMSCVHAATQGGQSNAIKVVGNCMISCPMHCIL